MTIPRTYKLSEAQEAEGEELVELFDAFAKEDLQDFEEFRSEVREKDRGKKLTMASMLLLLNWLDDKTTTFFSKWSRKWSRRKKDIRDMNTKHAPVQDDYLKELLKNKDDTFSKVLAKMKLDVQLSARRLLLDGAQRSAVDSEVLRLLASKQKSVLSKMRSRVDTVTRMEASREYDKNQHIILRRLNKKEEKYYKVMDEVIDRRNHPFSRAAHGTVSRQDKPFNVSVAAVFLQSRKMKKRASGMFWPKRGRYYVGSSYPAHFRDRGRVLIVHKDEVRANILLQDL